MATLVTWMNSERVGELTKQANGAHTFRYDEKWIQNPYARPLSLSLPVQRGVMTSAAVYNYFDNLLPDSPAVRDRVVQRYQAKSKQPFDLLAEIGRDSVGAVTLLPPEDNVNGQVLTWEPLDASRLENVLTAYQADIPLGMIEGADDFRISVAGAQEKTALLKVDDAWCIPKDTTPTTHIIKLPIGEIKQPDATLDLRESVDNEYFCLALAKALDIDVPDAEIIRTEKVRALAVERFDRRWARNKTVLLRLPQEDFCQVFGLPSSLKYESDGGPDIAQIMKFLLGSREALNDRHAFMRFQVFQWLTGATDGHAKNYSLFIHAGGSYQLTPFYDIMSAFPVLGGAGLHMRDLKLAMSLKATKGRKRALHQIYPRHFLATAKEVNFAQEQMEQILRDFADNVPRAVETVLASLPADFSASVAGAISTNMMKMHARLIASL